MKQQELEKSKEYKYGFTTNIESIRAPKGLNEEVIQIYIKNKKRTRMDVKPGDLKAYNRLKNVKRTKLAKTKISKN